MIAEKTAEVHARNIREKLGLETRARSPPGLPSTVCWTRSQDAPGSQKARLVVDRGAPAGDSTRGIVRMRSCEESGWSPHLSLSRHRAGAAQPRRSAHVVRGARA